MNNHTTSGIVGGIIGACIGSLWTFMTMRISVNQPDQRLAGILVGGSMVLIGVITGVALSAREQPDDDDLE